ncbi:hypothetical protein VPH35_123346 [Triticum aestivum]
MVIKVLKKFVKVVIVIFEERYLLVPNEADATRLLQMGASNSFPGICASIKCMHWSGIMGVGGRMTEKEREKQELLGRAGAVHAGPDREGNPASLLERSVIRSFCYVVHDLIIIVSLLYVALVWILALPSMPQLGAWPLALLGHAGLHQTASG